MDAFLSSVAPAPGHPRAARGSVQAGQPVLVLATCAVLYGLWLNSFGLVSFALGGEEQLVRGVALLLVLAPIGLQLALLHNGRVHASALALSALLILSVMASFLPTLEASQAPALIVSTLVLFAVALTLVAAPASLVADLLRVFAVGGAALLLLVVLFGEYRWGRLFGNDQPNAWARLGMAVAFATPLVRRRWLRHGIFALLLVLIYVTQSRATTLALLAGFGAAYCAFDLRRQGGRHFVMVAGAVALALPVLLVSWATVDSGIQAMLADPDVSGLVNPYDPVRGLGALDNGYVGRFTLWDKTIAIWQSSPLFGVGFRQHSAVLQGMVGETERLISAHNAYLAMLADQGLVGLIVYLSLIALALRAGLRLGARSQLGRICFMYVVGYAVLGGFERLTINAGNALSILFLVAALTLISEGARVRSAPPA
ncbi:O-antigen ligase family protein [Zavarzinia sp. CC-PAN008]|uniref:O-antigen ligase family protein n=1 Tax=Zavarzinia sp. CC-PAN008 TaxID=3243332 RepID=UPI003F745726